MTIRLRVIVLPLGGITEAERRATPRPQASAKFILTVERTTKFDSILTKIEQRYKRDYLTPQAARLFVIKSIADPFNFDIDIESTHRFDQLFDCDGPNIEENAVVRVTQGVLGRESSLLSRSSAQRSHYEEATSQHSGSKKRCHATNADPVSTNKKRKISQSSPGVLVSSTPRDSQRILGSSPPEPISAYAQSDVLGQLSPLSQVAETQSVMADLTRFSDNEERLVNSNVEADGEERVSEDEYGVNIFSDAVTEMLDQSSQVEIDTPAPPSSSQIDMLSRPTNPSRRQRSNGKGKLNPTSAPPPSSQISMSSQPASSPGPRRNNAKEKSHWTADEDKTARYVFSSIKDRKTWIKFLPGRTKNAIRMRVAKIEKGERLKRRSNKASQSSPANGVTPKDESEERVSGRKLQISHAGPSNRKAPKDRSEERGSASPVESIPSPKPMRLPKRKNTTQQSTSKSKTNPQQLTETTEKTKPPQSPAPIPPLESARTSTSDPIEITSDESSEDDSGGDDAESVGSVVDLPAAQTPSQKSAANVQAGPHSSAISIQVPLRSRSPTSTSAQLLPEANPASPSESRTSPSESRASSTRPLSGTTPRSASPEVQKEMQRESLSITSVDQMESMQPPKQRLSPPTSPGSEAASNQSSQSRKSSSVAPQSQEAATPTPRQRSNSSAASVTQPESMQPSRQRQSSSSTSASHTASSHPSQHGKSSPVAPTNQAVSVTSMRQRQGSSSSSGSQVASTQSLQHGKPPSMASMDEVTSMPPPPGQRQSSSAVSEDRVPSIVSIFQTRTAPTKAPSAQPPSTQPLNKVQTPPNPFIFRRIPSTQPTTITAWRAQHALDLEATRKAAAERRSSEMSLDANHVVLQSPAPGRKRPEGLDESKLVSDDSDSSEDSDQEDASTIFQRMSRRNPLQGLCHHIRQHGYGSLK